MPIRNFQHTQSEFDAYYNEHLSAWLESANEFSRANSLVYVFEKIYRYAIQSDIDELKLMDVRNKYAIALLDLSYLIKRDLPPDLRQVKTLLRRVLSVAGRQPVPIAYYRMAFVAFYEGNYTEAIHFAEIALREKNEPFDLNGIQIKNANNLKLKCALKVLLQTQTTAMNEESDPEISKLFKELIRNNDVGEKPIIQKIWKNGEITDEIELYPSEYEHLLSKIEADDDQIFFDLYDFQPNLTYRKMAELTEKQVQILKILLNIHEDTFGVLKPDENYQKERSKQQIRNAKNQNIRRLRENLSNLHGLEDRFSIINPADGAPYIKTDLTINIFERAIL